VEEVDLGEFKMPKVNGKHRKISLMSEYEKFEIQEVFDRTKTIDSLRIQIYSFFGTVNITSLGLALTRQQAGIFLIAASMIGLLALIDRVMRKHQAYFYTRGLELEDRFSPEKESALLHSYLLKSHHLSQSRLRRYWITLSIFFSQVLLAIASWYFLKWNWF
jgi:hypothetical protein